MGPTQQGGKSLLNDTSHVFDTFVLTTMCFVLWITWSR